MLPDRSANLLVLRCTVVGSAQLTAARR